MKCEGGFQGRSNKLVAWMLLILAGWSVSSPPACPFPTRLETGCDDQKLNHKNPFRAKYKSHKIYYTYTIINFTWSKI